MAGDLVVAKIKFGWCIDGGHQGCRIRFSYYDRDYQCSCQCHLTESLPALVPGQNMTPIDPNKPEQPQRKNSRKKKI